MPTYVYRREDGSTFEIEQRITEDALTTDPETGQPVERIISGSAGLIFKGSGFYQTDYVRNNNGNGSSNSKESSSSDAGSSNGASDASNGTSSTDDTSSKKAATSSDTD